MVWVLNGIDIMVCHDKGMVLGWQRVHKLTMIGEQQASQLYVLLDSLLSVGMALRRGLELA